MTAGILAGILWALETVILGMALSMTQFVSTEQAVFLAPFVSTFLHDLCSALCAAIYNAVRGNAKKVFKAFRTKSGKWVVLAAAIGGPVGMTGYVMSINYMGASIGAVASAVFPAIGAVIAYIFLKEKMKWYQWVFLLLTMAGVYGLGYSPEITVTNFWLGLLGTAMCSVGWGVEAVIIAYGLRDPEVTDEFALQIRQTTSALIYGVIILPVLGGWGFTASLFTGGTGMLLPLIALAAVFATASYLFYYKAISQIGASMALNITYSAWAIVFTVILTRDMSVINPLTVGCTVVVIISGILAAADFRELFSKSKSK